MPESYLWDVIFSSLMPSSSAGEAPRTSVEGVEKLARERYRTGERWHPLDVARGPWVFLREYLLRRQLLEGRAGFLRARRLAHQERAIARWLHRLDREIGGAVGRGPWASRVRAIGRRWVVAMATALWPTPRAALPAAHALRKLLVIRTDERVGNQLLTTPLLRALKLGLPHAELHLLAAARQAPVVVSPHVDRVLPFEKRWAFRCPWRLVGLLRALRREHYDVVIEAGHWSAFSLTACLLARISAGMGAVVGHARGESARFLSHPVQHDPVNCNEVRAKLELLRPFGLWPQGLAPETALGERGPAAARAEALLTQLHISPASSFAVLNPGARMAERRWPPSAHAAVACGLLDRGLEVLVVWGPGEERLASTIAERSGAILAPLTRLPELAALLRRARLCVSNDTGPMHLAVAVGTPTVGVFLASDPHRWGHELPIFEAAVPRGESDARTVLEACDRLLAQYGSTRRLRG